MGVPITLPALDAEDRVFRAEIETPFDKDYAMILHSEQVVTTEGEKYGSHVEFAKDKSYYKCSRLPANNEDLATAQFIAGFNSVAGTSLDVETFMTALSTAIYAGRAKKRELDAPVEE